MSSAAMCPRMGIGIVIASTSSRSRVGHDRRSIARSGVDTSARRLRGRRRCSSDVGTAVQAEVQEATTEDDSSDRFVYVGNLDFFEDPADVERVLFAALARMDPASPAPVSIGVPDWGSGPRVDQRKKRDEGKLNRGFAVLEFADPSAGRTAAAALDGADVNGRSVRSSAGITVKPETTAVDETKEDEAAVEARAERRAHNRRQRRRRKQRDAAALEERLDTLMRTHPLWTGDDGPIVGDDEPMGASSREPDTDETTDSFAKGLWWDDAAWRLGWGSLYSTWAHADDAKALGYVDWEKCPPSADPAGSNKRGGAARGERKRLQVESFRAVVNASAETLGLDGSRRPTIVDFGCGTGNLLLPLAAEHPEADFVGLDLNPRSIELLARRASDAGLTNVQSQVGLVEEYTGPCDLALALHVCGSGTDAVLLQAQARNAAFVVAPCCIGKLRDGGLKSVAGMRRAISTFEDTHTNGDLSTEDDDDSSEELVVRPGNGMPAMRVIHPRSRWMRGEVQRPVYMGLAAAADWSGHAGVDAMRAFTGELGRLPRAAKAAVELDRGAAAAEAGYGVRMMKMLHPGAGLKNDIILGFPRGADPLKEHVFGPDASF